MLQFFSIKLPQLNFTASNLTHLIYLEVYKLLLNSKLYLILTPYVILLFVVIKLSINFNLKHCIDWSRGIKLILTRPLNVCRQFSIKQSLTALFEKLPRNSR